MMLPRPNYTKLDPFFAKKGGSIYFRARLFFGVMSVTFLGPGRAFFGTPGRFPEYGGGFQDMGGDLNRGFLAGHRLKIKDNLHMRCQCDSLIIKAPLGSPSLYKKAPW